MRKEKFRILNMNGIDIKVPPPEEGSLCNPDCILNCYNLTNRCKYQQPPGSPDKGCPWYRGTSC